MANESKPHGPLSIKEGRNAFLALWNAGGGKKAFMRLGKQKHDRFGPPAINLPHTGFAISGGVDSMALAYLWHRFISNRPSYNPVVRGFVVDHGLRPGSAKEAQVVASRLEPLLGQPGQIITLNWNRYGGIKNITSMETVARRLRFQVLGEAARAHHLQCILLGHHADDVNETVLFRLAKGSRGTGLLGMKAISNIPECDDRFGIHSSGAFRRPQWHKSQRHYIGGPENGGIKVGRPLLEFPKSRLIATCKSAAIEWTTDSTNEDVRLTQRNTIRVMMKRKNWMLPVALRSPSIQGLVKDIKDTSEIRKGLTEKLYAATKIDSFDLRSGVMCLHLPSSNAVTKLLNQFPNQDIVFEAFSTLLHSLVECVSSVNVKLEVLKPASATIFKELTTRLCDQSNTSLSVGQIIIERTEPLILDNETHIGLRLHQAPLMSSSFSSRDSSKEITLSPIERSDARGSVDPDNFQLWHGRWWMQVENYSPVPLRIEALDKEKISAFRGTMHGHHWTKYNELFSEAAPGISRWTIPAIVCDEAPPAGSMIPPNAKSWRKSPKRAGREQPFVFPILKYDPEDPLPYCIPISGKITTASLEEPLVGTFDNTKGVKRGNFLKPPQRLAPIPSILQGEVDADKYPKATGPFIVAIPTMGMFLNSYWASKLEYDIRYKAIPLTDMNYISSYRMEKPIMVDSSCASSSC